MDAAERLSVSLRKLQYLAKEGELERKKEGRRSYYRVPLATPGALGVSETPVSGVTPVAPSIFDSAAYDDVSDDAPMSGAVETDGAYDVAPSAITMDVVSAPESDAHPAAAEAANNDTEGFPAPPASAQPDWVVYVDALERRVEALEAEVRAIRDGVTFGVERVEDRVERLTQQVRSVRAAEPSGRAVESTPASTQAVVSDYGAPQWNTLTSSPYQAANLTPASGGFSANDAELLHAALLEQLEAPKPVTASPRAVTASSARVPARKSRTVDTSLVGGAWQFVRQFFDWVLGRSTRR